MGVGEWAKMLLWFAVGPNVLIFWVSAGGCKAPASMVVFRTGSAAVGSTDAGPKIVDDGDKVTLSSCRSFVVPLVPSSDPRLPTNTTAMTTTATTKKRIITRINLAFYPEIDVAVANVWGGSNNAFSPSDVCTNQ